MKNKFKYIIIMFFMLVSLTACNNKNNISEKELVAKYDGNQISTKKLYEKLKEKNGLDLVLDEVDKTILNKLYKRDSVEDEYYKKELNTLTINYQVSYASRYSTFAEFITKVLGLKNENELDKF